MATVLYNPSKDWFNILSLAGGDHFDSVLVGTNLVNNTVTQTALDAAIISDSSGMKSQNTLIAEHDALTNGISSTDLSKAILGDATSIQKIQTAVGPVAVGLGSTGSTTPLKNNLSTTVPPTISDDNVAGYNVGSMWVMPTAAYICMDSTASAAVWHRIDGGSTSIGPTNNYTATVAPIITNDNTQGYSIGSIWIDTFLKQSYVCVSSAINSAIWHRIDITGTSGGSSVVSIYSGSVITQSATTLFTNIPFVDDVAITPVNMTNVSGVITVGKTGVYTISVTLPFIATNRKELQTIHITKNGVQVGPIANNESVKDSFSGTVCISNFSIALSQNDIISVQYLGTFGTTYSAFLTIVEV